MPVHARNREVQTINAIERESGSGWKKAVVGVIDRGKMKRQA